MVYHRIEIPGSRLKRLSLFALFSLFTRKRVCELFQRYLIARIIFLQLISDVVLYHFLVLSYCIHIVSPTPEIPVAVFLFEVGMSVEDH